MWIVEITERMGLKKAKAGMTSDSALVVYWSAAALALARLASARRRRS
jgi:MYXO-CTERM domain-containing protein